MKKVKADTHRQIFDRVLASKQSNNTMQKLKSLALVAHDNRKQDLVEWVKWNREILIEHQIVCTGTTGKMVEATLAETEGNKDRTIPHPVRKLNSGPLGGDQQLGALIANSEVDILIFFWDPMQPQPHDVDVQALLRIAVLFNIPTACNRATADFVISSPLLAGDYQAIRKDYSDYTNRTVST